MARQSLRDDLVRGSGRRTSRKSSRKPLWIALTVGGSLVLLAALMLFTVDGTESGDAVVQNDSFTPITVEKPQVNDSVATDSNVDQENQQPVQPVGAVRSQIDALRIVNGYSDLQYDRDLFGQTWFDQDRNGCDTRNDILGRDLTNIVVKEGTNGCKVLSGTLEDWYSGRTVEFVSGTDTSQLVQIDHVVPLSWAWHHGADVWTDEKRREFANDPINLIATTSEMNQSKSDSGPSSWLPSNDQALCRYAQAFTGVLSTYELGVDLRDRAMILGILEECAVSELFGVFEP